MNIFTDYIEAVHNVPNSKTLTWTMYSDVKSDVKKPRRVARKKEENI
jgi:hypothetical protein